jgi:hypothetical protein
MKKSGAINKLIQVAEEEIGYLEKKSAAALDNKTANAGDNNYTKYWRDVKPNYQGQPWCAAFISWCFLLAFGLANAGKLLKHWPYVYCPDLGNLFTRYSNPEVGDIVIFYRNGKFVHTGLVIKVSGDYFETIEGNTSGASGIIPNGGGVCKKSYYNSNLPGTKFCRPDYNLLEIDDTSGNQKSLNKQPQWTGVVTASVLNVRKWAGIEYPRLNSNPVISKGTSVEVCDTVKDSMNADWYYIRMQDGIYGFVSAIYIKKR